MTTRTIQQPVLAFLGGNTYHQSRSLVMTQREIPLLGMSVVASYNGNGTFKGFEVTGLSPNQSASRKVEIGDLIFEINDVKLLEASPAVAYQEFIQGMETTPVTLKLVGKPLAGPHNSKIRRDKSNRPILHSEPPKWTLITIKLRKSKSGFGFVLSACGVEKSPDRPTCLNTYVKMYTNDQCRDSGLKVGDRILMVGKQSVGHMSKKEISEILRGVPIGDWVELKIARSPMNTILKGSMALLVAFAETQSAGLGICLKTLNDRSSRIFIASILRGGALWKDGRAKEGDRILAINNISIENEESTETALEKLIIAVQRKSPFGDFFSLVLSRGDSDKDADHSLSPDCSYECGGKEPHLNGPGLIREDKYDEFHNPELIDLMSCRNGKELKAKRTKQSIKSLRQFLKLQEGWKHV